MEINLCEKLGKRIRELRIARGIKQGELADMLEMERSNLTRIENGKQRPNDNNIIKLAGIFDVEIHELYNFSHIKTKKELLKKIEAELSLLSEKEIQYVYKTIKNIKSLNS